MTRLRIALVLGFLWSCGGAAPQPAEPKNVPEALANERMHVDVTERPVVELRVVFQGGSVDDPQGKEGLAALTVATMLEGRAGKLSYAERERKLFPMAAQIGGNVEREQIVFAGRVHKDHLAAFYPLFRDILRAPAFDPVDFERIRARNLSALTQDLRGADDEQLGKELLQAMVFENHPYGYPELGKERGIAAATVDDARAFWARVLCAKRVHVAISGAVDDATVQALKADLGALTSDACTWPRVIESSALPKGRRLWMVDKPEAQSVAISLGMPIAVTRAHPDYPALMLAAAYFGQHRTFAGRLMQRIRVERGLNYGDYAYAEHFVQDGHTRFPAPNVARRQQYFSMWLRPVPVDKAHFTLRLAVRELETFVEQGISEADFERIRRFAERYFALFAQTEQQRLGNVLDDIFYGVKGPHLEQLCRRIGSLTREAVNQAIKAHLKPDQLQMALVGPRAVELVDAIVANTPSPMTYPSEKSEAILAEDRVIEVHPVGVTRDRVRIIPLAQVFQ